MAVVFRARSVFGAGAVLKTVLLLSKGILGDQQLRRQMMFYTILAAMLMLFAGATFLQEWLREHLAMLVLYWGACAWLTVTAALLAVFDLLLLRAVARAERKRLEAELRERK